MLPSRQLTRSQYRKLLAVAMTCQECGGPMYVSQSGFVCERGCGKILLDVEGMDKEGNRFKVGPGEAMEAMPERIIRLRNVLKFGTCMDEAECLKEMKR